MRRDLMDLDTCANEVSRSVRGAGSVDVQVAGILGVSWCPRVERYRDQEGCGV